LNDLASYFTTTAALTRRIIANIAYFNFPGRIISREREREVLAEKPGF
jgi:hypothetical protein